MIGDYLCDPVVHATGQIANGGYVSGAESSSYVGEDLSHIAR